MGLNPPVRWKTTPKPNIVVNARLTLSLGRAHSADGKVEVGGAYIGCISQEAFHQLDQTILHELAHLAVGVHHGHNSVWKRAAKRFGVINPASTTPICDELTLKLYKWSVYCITESGKEYFYNRYKSSPPLDLLQYDGNDPDRLREYTVYDEKIIKFEKRRFTLDNQK